MDLRLAGRCYVVTGASRGLGFAAAKVLIDEGAMVVLVARDQLTLNGAVAALGPNAFGVAADLGAASTAENATAAAMARFGRLDGTLISAGSPPPATPMTATDEAWRAAFETLFVGGMRMVRATVLVATQEAGVTGTGASIVFVSSSSAKSTLPGMVLSNDIRPGLVRMIKDLADEIGPRGVRVNGILPGRIATDAVFAQDAQQGDPMAVRRRREAGIPLRRYGEPEEFGRLAAFLLSPASSYVTGSVVAADGGLLRAL